MKEIEIAVQWWLDQMKGRSGDSDIDMHFILAMRGNIAPLTEEQMNAFKTSLTRLLSEHLKRQNYCSLSTDYGPADTLQDACLEAKINDASSRLPMKTLMSIRRGKVSVGCGYGAKAIPLYEVDQTES